MSGWPPRRDGPAARCASPGTWRTGRCARAGAADARQRAAQGRAPRRRGSSGSARPSRSMITQHGKAPGWSCWPEAAARIRAGRPVRTPLPASASGHYRQHRSKISCSAHTPSREVRLRGLLATAGPPRPSISRAPPRRQRAAVPALAGHRTDQPPQKCSPEPETSTPPETMLTAAIGDAETLRLPHQIPTDHRLAGHPGVCPDRRYTSSPRAALPAWKRNSTPAQPDRPALRHPPCHRASSQVRHDRARTRKSGNDGT